MTANQQVGQQEIQQVLSEQPAAPVLFAEHVAVVGHDEGGAIDSVAPGEQAADRIRPQLSPPHILPRKVSGFVDREQEQGQVGRALARGQVVGLHGPDGIGKTAVLSRTMRAQLPSVYPDGMAYLTAQSETETDLLQALFACFYASDADVAIDPNLVSRYMAGKRALIAVDDADHLTRSEADKLVHAAPDCAILFAGEQPSWPGGANVVLRGLPADQALALFERHWGRVSVENRATVGAICAALDNVPLAVIKAATIAVLRQVPLHQVLQHVLPRGSERNPARQVFRLIRSVLSREERQVLGAVAAPGGKTVGVDALPVLTGLSSETIREKLDHLEKMGLVQSNSPRYSVDGGLRPHIRGSWTDEGMLARAADYYLRYANRLHGRPKDPDEENVMGALRYYFQRRQWREVIHIARVVERYLATAGRWGQWEKRLKNAWYAAREINDRATEAWAQNQLGIIAMRVGDTAAAAHLFKAALGIWQELGRQAGATIARWNLQVLLGPPPTPPRRGRSPDQGGGSESILPIALGTTAVVLTVFLVLIIIYILRPGPTPPPVTEPPPVCVCGNQVCDSGPPCGESSGNCPQDCPITEPPPCVCGNGSCERGAPCQENGYNCTEECCQCGDGICESEAPCGETSDQCPQDCPITEPPPCVCGNGFCERGAPCQENGYNCTEECCQCGDGICEPDAPCGESPDTCIQDCPITEPPPCVCGNGLCERDAPCKENGYNCTEECCRCGDGICEPDAPCNESPAKCPGDCPLPDLVVTSLAVIGIATIDEVENVKLPIRVVVSNQGGYPAGIFKVSISFSIGSSSYVTPFFAPGQQNSWFPYTSAPLDANSQVVFEGGVTIWDDFQGETVSLRALADSCAEEDDMPGYCRVQESREENNESAPVVVEVPSQESGEPPPAPTPLEPGDSAIFIPFDCPAVLRWNPVSAPAGIAEYQAELQECEPDRDPCWDLASFATGLTSYDVSSELMPGPMYYLRWRVRAVDTADRSSEPSQWLYFKGGGCP